MGWQRLAKLAKGLVLNGIEIFPLPVLRVCVYVCVFCLGCAQIFSGDALFGQINATLNKVEIQAHTHARALTLARTSIHSGHS